MTDPYGILGVNSSASDEEISRAYKKLAKKYHPDLNPGNTRAAERMGQINQAYDEIKAMRQSGNRSNSQPRHQSQGYGQGYGAAHAYEDPFGFYTTAYRQQQSRYQQSQQGQRRGMNPFRMVFMVVFIVIIFRFLALLIGGTAPVQNFISGNPGSLEPDPGYYQYFQYNPYSFYR